MGDFVWHIKCMNTCSGYSENCLKLFWLILQFLHFLPRFETFKPLLITPDKMQPQNAEIDLNCGIIIESFSCEVTFCHKRPKMVQKFQIWTTYHQRLNSAKKAPAIS